MDTEQKVTIDHKEIEEWVKKNNGTPEIVGYEDGVGEPSLRIDFPGIEDEMFLSDETKLTKVSWKDFFKEFDKQGLAFEYMDYEKMIDPSASYHFIKRQAVNG